MAGIVFIRTTNLLRIREFYTGHVGMTAWLEQTGITILAHENMLIGFQEAETIDRDCLLTFWFRTRSEVDTMYTRFRASAVAEPAPNSQFGIYNFFATDPDERRIEFQAFLHDTNEVSGVPPLPPA